MKYISAKRTSFLIWLIWIAINIWILYIWIDHPAIFWTTLFFAIFFQYAHDHFQKDCIADIQSTKELLARPKWILLFWKRLYRTIKKDIPVFAIFILIYLLWSTIKFFLIPLIAAGLGDTSLIGIFTDIAKALVFSFLTIRTIRLKIVSDVTESWLWIQKKIKKRKHE